MEAAVAPSEMRIRTGRRWAGNAVFLLALLGLLLCLGGIAGAWIIRNRVLAVGNAVFETTDEAFESVSGKLDRVKQGLERSHFDAGELSRIAGRFKSVQSDFKLESEPLLQILNSACQNLQSAEPWLESAETITSGVCRVTEAFVSSDFAVSRQESASVALARDLQVIAGSIADYLAQLESMRRELAALRNSGTVALQAIQALLDRMSALDGVVNRLRGGIEHIDAKVAAARVTFAERSRRFRRWTLAATLAASILPLWFGFSQGVVLAYGRRMARST
jgi:DNA repair ATPase RecN